MNLPITDQPMASIVIPFYNGQKWLSAIKEQINGQTWSNLEVILVNDGSTDIQPHELDDFFSGETRYRIIHKKNSGAGATRNIGLQASVGKYVFFYDIDDVLATTMVEESIQRAELHGADVVVFDYDMIDGEGITVKSVDVTDHVPSAYPEIFDLSQIAYRFDFSPNCWNKCYRRDFLVKNQIFFSDTRSSNDFKFSVLALFSATRISLLKKRLYGYRSDHDNCNGITGGLSQTSSDCLVALEELFNFLKHKELFTNQNIQKRFYDFARSILYYNLKGDINFSNASIYANKFDRLGWLQPVSPKNLARHKKLRLRIFQFRFLRAFSIGGIRVKLDKKFNYYTALHSNLKMIMNCQSGR
jgi:glycosyltransferase involved in cell wall biosynthesis